MNAPQVMSLQEAVEAGLLEGSMISRAQTVVDRVNALQARPGAFMESIEAARLFGSMHATIEGLMHELYVSHLRVRGLERLLGVEVSQ
ncbi:hypothetical protein [Kitasatospora cathayae]|uniref:Uncharacterized protein n=1 Tax=Kitasatospora cathayae TaxID=3004092 RepID=A0ABY7Q9R2_9ACTN|nr:hypothetical protein [Kitasatospora sp. HUAS 3-15]WBP89475.1 hypothetical protein O1G21_28990 [Kitasatospora sp. HUAS 3-15]